MIHTGIRLIGKLNLPNWKLVEIEHIIIALLLKSGAILDLGSLSFHPSVIIQFFAQYHENKFIEFYQILYMR